MKKNLTIVIAALIVAAMAIPASASKLTLTGAYEAKWTYKNEVVTPEELKGDSKLSLNLKFEEGESIVAYLPLTIKPFVGAPTVSLGNWYFSYETAPVAFWVSNNHWLNPYSFGALGDPLGIGGKLPSTLVANAKGEIVGAGFDFYVADLGRKTVTSDYLVGIEDEEAEGGYKKDDEGKYVTEKPKVESLENGNVFMGRITYGLPADFTLGLVGAYTDGIKSASFKVKEGAVALETIVDEEGEEIGKIYRPEDIIATVGDNADDLTFGVDIAGKIPGIDANLKIAGAGYWKKTADSAWGFDPVPTNDNYAYQLALTDMAVGPVTNMWAKYTAVGGNFNSHYATMKSGTILKDYKGEAAAQVGLTVGIPVGIPVELTLGNQTRMTYAADPKWNETTAEVVVDPLKDLKVTVSGAYKADLIKDSTEHDGYKVHGDVSYDAFGLNFNPYVDYLVKSYADSPDEDTVIGIDIAGNPIDELEIGANASYTVEEPITDLFGYGIYTTDLNPGFVITAKSQVAAVAGYEKEAEEEAATKFYAYAGTDLGITDALTAKAGVLTKDSKDGVVASATLSYKASESITTGLTLTHRQKPAGEPTGWKPFEDEGKNYLYADVKGTVGASTITIAYGDKGLGDAPQAPDFNAGKPWAYLWNRSADAMNWQKLTLSVKVPF